MQSDQPIYPAHWTSLPAMFFDQAERFGDRPLLWAKRGDAYAPLSWREAADEVWALARGLVARGVAPGDRVLLLAENRPRWVIADLAIMLTGAITVPAYTTYTADDLRHLLADCQPRGALVSTAGLTERLLDAAAQAPPLAFVASLEAGPEDAGSGRVPRSWQALAEEGRDKPGDLAATLAALSLDRTACIIYTSGTGGRPKGVMQSHGGILHDCGGAARMLQELDPQDERFLSFLPLSHAYEHTCGLYLPMVIGAEIFYAEGLQHLAANLLEARPTLMISVPRLLEVTRQRILGQVARAGRFRRWLFQTALDRGRAVRDGRYSAIAGLLGRPLDWLLDRLVRGRVQARFGGRLKLIVSGGAPLGTEVWSFFDALGIAIREGYGLTEASPVVTCNPFRAVKPGSLGPPFDGVEVRIGDEGEVLVSGPTVMQGYWGNEAATRDALRDGWLHTGDIGTLDDDGYLTVVDRLSDMIVLNGGDNVSPQRAEAALTRQPEIAQAMVYGDRRPYLVAVLVPEPDHVRQWAKRNGRRPSLADLAADPAFNKQIMAAVGRANDGLSAPERVRRCTIAEEPFTIENKELSATLKVRRHRVVDRYGTALAGLYHNRSGAAADPERATEGPDDRPAATPPP